MANLYQLTGEILALQSMAYEEDDEAFKDTLEALQLEQHDAIEYLTKLMKNITADVDAHKAEEARLKKSREVLEHRIERIHTAIFNAVKATGEKSFKTSLFSYTVKSNPPSVKYDVPEDKIPKMFRIKQPDKIDKQAIKDYIKSGKSCTFAHLEQGESLVIR